MQAFRTVVNPDKLPFKVSHKDSLVSIGSCFSENIGKRFADYKFNIQINPFGQQYNPMSVASSIQRLLSQKPYTANDLVFHDELYHSFDHHGSYSRATIEDTLQVINENLHIASSGLQKAAVLFLTFGTSHVFELKETNTIVSNCHKLSGTMFNRRLLHPGEIVATLTAALKDLRAVNPDVHIVLTVSPVRYFAFGPHENTISKSHLFTAIHHMMEQDKTLHYFPAYELVIDDLRDYRFFAEDMLHPNYFATNYVWETLCKTVFAEHTLALLKQIDEVISAARHRPRNPKSEAHRAFTGKYIRMAEQLQTMHALNFSEEITQLLRFTC